MSEFISEKLNRIQTHLEHGEVQLAKHLVREVEIKPDVSATEKVKIDIYKAQVLLESGKPEDAQQLIIPLINEISKWPKSVQLQILHVASQLASFLKDYRLLEVYTTKFQEIYDSISSILQEKSVAFYADILNYIAQLAVVNMDYSNGLSIYEKAISLQRKLDRPFQRAVSLYNGGKTANLMELASRAELFLEESYRIFKDLKHLEGQYLVAQELIKTYGLHGDQSSIISFQQISSDLEQKIKVSKLEQEKDLQTSTLSEENSQLRQQIFKMMNEIKALKLHEKHLKEGITYMQSKLDDFNEIRLGYDKSQDRTAELVNKVHEQQKIIKNKDQKIGELTEKIDMLRQKLTMKDGESKIEKISQSALDQILAESKLLQTVFKRLQELKSSKVRILALQLQISMSNCQSAIKELETLDVVEVDSWNFSSPTVTIKEEYL